MKIIRAPRQGHFTIVPNATARDAALSFRARGVLTYLLSHEDGWTTSAERLKDAGKEGRDAIRKALDELKEARYLVVRRRRADKGRWEYDHFIYDTPQPEEDPDTTRAAPPVDNSPSTSPTPPVDNSGGDVSDPTDNSAPQAKGQVRPHAGNQQPVYQPPVHQQSAGQDGVVRSRAISGSLEALPQKTTKKTPPPPTSPAQPDPNSAAAAGVEEQITSLLDALPPALQPRSPRQAASYAEVLRPWLDSAWDPQALLAHAAMEPLPEIVLNPPGFVRQRLANLPATPPAPRPTSAPWCGQCRENTRMIEDPVTAIPHRCPACHPAFLDAEATG